MTPYMKHTIHTLEHPVKSAFMDKVYAYVDHEDIDALLVEYVLESEHQDGVGFWDNFTSVKEAVEDFKRFVEYANECSWAYEE